MTATRGALLEDGVDGSGRRPILLLDVMGTLVHDPFFTHMAPFFGLSFEELLEQKHPTLWIDFECGRVTEDELFDRFFLDRRPIDRPAFREMLHDAYAWLPGVRPLLSKLRGAGYVMHLLSNYPEWYRIIEEKLELSEYALWSFVSWDTGLHKPDRAVYRHAAETLGVTPSECLFVDDREVNCEGAREVGMQAIVFESAEALEREIVGRFGPLSSP